MELKTDSELIQEYILNKSEKAAFEIVNRYKNFVFATALRYSGSYDDADDISQEVFMRVFSNLHKFQEKSALRTWLYRITINTYLNSHNKRNINNVLMRDNNINLDDYRNNLTTPDQDLEYKEINEHFMRALLTLPKRQREVFALRFFDKMKYDEMSELLGLTVGGLKANYYHAIRKIIKLMKNDI